MRSDPLCRALRRCLPLVLCAPALPLLAASPSSAPGAMPVDAPAEAAGPAQPHELDTVVVSATRSRRALKDVPASVDVIERERMDVQLVRDIRDLVRYEPGVSVTSGYGRFGLGGFRIRGLDGNRVLIQADGIKQADAFAIGSYASANRNFVDMDTLKRAEIVRGPASALYGSDALGGVVAFTTRDPEDYVAAGKHGHIGVKFGYDGSRDGLFAGVSSAFVGARLSGMLVAGHRQGQATRNMGQDASDGATRTTPNPQSHDGRSVLAKLVLEATPTQRFTLTVEGNEDRTETDVRSARGYAAMTRYTTTDQQAEDRQRRSRVSLAHALSLEDFVLADSVDWQLYHQESRTRQRTWEYRHNPALQQRRDRLFAFDARVDGLQLRADKSFATGAVGHRVGWGIEARRSRIAQQRDGSQTDLATGITGNTVYPDVFPVRDFPLSTIDEIGLYVQDEIELADGRLSLIPALRVDHYRLAPKVDAIFAEDNPGMDVVGLRDTRLSPKFGALWRFAGDWSVYGNYAQGFRAPPFNDVNLGFTNVQGGYAAIPNADLRPETSRGIELGLRRAGAAGWASLAVYQTEYKDFIESQVYIGRSAEGLMLFQSRNVSDAVIRGVEGKFGLEFGALDPRWQGWRLRGAIAHARGDDRSAGQPLASIDPLRASLGLGYEAGAWGVELAASGAARKRRILATAALPDPWQPPGHVVLDLLWHAAFAPGARLDAGVFNLADRRYADWAGVPGVAADSRTLDRYTMPGRHLGVSLALAW